MASEGLKVVPTKTCSKHADLTILGNETDAIQDANDYVKHPKVPTVDELMKAIPKRCFERSYIKSFAYLIFDCILVAITYLLFTKLEPVVPPALTIPYWILYAVVQGTIGTGLWVIGHECGHGSFCNNKFLNDFVGYILHTVLLVPYYSWQYSHNKHHQHTNHLVWGDSHVPFTWEEDGKYITVAMKILGEDAYFIWSFFSHFIIGWFCYIFYYKTGGRCDYNGEPLDNQRHKNHFIGHNSQLYPPEFSFKIYLSTLGILATLCGIFYAGMTFGWCWLLKVYIGPYFVINFWLVFITFLHHTQPNVPHYGDKSFTWLRGTLGTIDRNYPTIIDLLHHHIGTTHVLHHFETKVPHYHAQEATEAIKKVLGPLYRCDNRSLWVSAYEALTTCQYVDGVEGVQYYKNYCDYTKKGSSSDRVDQKVLHHVERRSNRHD